MDFAAVVLRAKGCVWGQNASYHRDAEVMIKQLVRKGLGKFGLQITRIPKELGKQPVHGASKRNGKNRFVESLTHDPLDWKLHLQYAEYASKVGNPFLAYAELKTAEALDGEGKMAVRKYHEIGQARPSLASMNHNQYFRFASLSSELIARAGGSKISVLDVGGGNGELASFIPDASYCLAEPRVNGISGTNLPFLDHSFDYVVSCHVLEHVPVDERVVFLDQLFLKAKRGVILLNPFYVAGTRVEERLELVLRLTGAQWAKEHLDCTLPNIQDIKDYANGKGLEISIKPNGTMTTSMAFVFVDYFAAKSGLRKECGELNRFFNEKYMGLLDSKEYPNAYLIYLGWPDTKGDGAD